MKANFYEKLNLYVTLVPTEKMVLMNIIILILVNVNKHLAQPVVILKLFMN